MGLVWDLGMVGFVFVAMIMGTLRGIRRELVRVAVVVFAVLSAWLLQDHGQWALRRLFSLSDLSSTFLAFPAVLVSASLLGGICGRILEMRKRWGERLSLEDRLYGGGFGFARGGLIAYLLTSIVSTYPLPADPFGASAFVTALREQTMSATIVMPGEFRKPMAAVARMTSDPERMQAFLETEEIRRLADLPQVRAVISDPDFRAMASERNPALLNHPGFAALLADPEFQKRLQEIDFEKIEKTVSSR